MNVSGGDRTAVAHAIAMLHGSREYIRDGFDPAMRVPRKPGQIVCGDIVAEVVEKQERILLIKLAGGYDPSRKIDNFAGKLVRSADDITPRLVPSPNGQRPIHHDFKGAADCVSGRLHLIVWSM